MTDLAGERPPITLQGGITRSPVEGDGWGGGVLSLPSRWLGRLRYDDAHSLQIRVRDAIIGGGSNRELLLLEHEPVITYGRRGELGDVLVSPTELAKLGISLRAAERGGRATYHAPGQLVGYPIVRLRTLAPSVPAYVWGLEDALIGTAARLGVVSGRREGLHGVWVGNAKLTSIGIAITHGVCWHGFALNVDPDLSRFDLIRPCGLEAPTTSIAALVGHAPPVEDVATLVAEEIARVFPLPR
ncbi:MAG: lipoate-protein ligase [Chloroflexi bacterium]|nr:lipoate-protein ligase [Chloroflexota bacterium]